MPDGPLRVCWLIKGLGPGGAERLLVTLGATMDRSLVRPEVVYTLPYKQHLVPQLEALGVPTHLLDGGRPYTPGWTAALRRRLLGSGYHVVHVHSPALAPVARVLCRAPLPPGRPRPHVLYTEHNLWEGYGLVTRVLNAATYPLDERRVAVSQGVHDGLPGPWKRRTEVLPNGVPVQQIATRRHERTARRAELGLADHEVVVLTVANLREGKNYPGLLRAAKQVVDRGLPVRFLSVGQGPLAGQLAEERTRIGLTEEQFRFLGYVEDPVPTMAAADVFAMSSWQEGHSIALMEALSTGLPVVVTAVGGNVEVVRDGTDGLLVPAGNDDALADALAALVADEPRRAAMGRAAAQRAGDFDIAVMARRLEALYAEVATRS